MARFLLDHNVSRRLVSELHLLGHDAETARDLGLGRADDDQLLTAATDAGRVLVTHNGQDFRALHRAWHRWSRRWGAREAHGGILVLRPQRPELPVAEAARVLDEAVGRYQLANALFEYTRPPAARWRHEVVR